MIITGIVLTLAGLYMGDFFAGKETAGRVLVFVSFGIHLQGLAATIAGSLDPDEDVVNCITGVLAALVSLMAVYTTGYEWLGFGRGVEIPLFVLALIALGVSGILMFNALFSDKRTQIDDRN